MKLKVLTAACAAALWCTPAKAGNWYKFSVVANGTKEFHDCDWSNGCSTTVTPIHDAYDTFVHSRFMEPFTGSVIVSGGWRDSLFGSGDWEFGYTAKLSWVTNPDGTKSLKGSDFRYEGYCYGCVGSDPIDWSGTVLTADTFGVSVEDYGGAISAVPEPATWAMMLLGFGVVGGALRRKMNMKPAAT